MPDCRVVVQLLHPQAQLPRKAYPSDAAYDLFLPQEVTLAPGQRQVLPMGLALELEEGWEAQVRGRSCLAKRGLHVHLGTIDHLYRLELGVLVQNLSEESIHLKEGERVAQLKIERVWDTLLVEGPVQPTSRGGFGSTGR